MGCAVDLSALDPGPGLRHLVPGRIHTAAVHSLTLLAQLPRRNAALALDDGLLLSTLSGQEIVAGTLRAFLPPLVWRILGGLALGGALLLCYAGQEGWFIAGQVGMGRGWQVVLLLPATALSLLLAGTLGALRCACC